MPLTLTVAVPMSTPLRSTSNRSSAPSAAERVPWICGVTSLVEPLLATLPSTGATLSRTLVMLTDWLGALVSIRTTWLSCVPGLPAASMTRVRTV